MSPSLKITINVSYRRAGTAVPARLSFIYIYVVKRIFLKFRLAKVPVGWYNVNGRDTDER